MGRGRRSNHLAALLARLKSDEAFAFTLSSRLCSNVLVDPLTLCWEWQRRRDPCGYGMLAVRLNGGRPVPFRVHVLAWILFRGRAISKHVRAHTCDNPPCCNPDHIESKTTQGNHDDALERYRHTSWKTRKYFESHGDKGAPGPNVPF